MTFKHYNDSNLGKLISMMIKYITTAVHGEDDTWHESVLIVCLMNLMMTAAEELLHTSTCQSAVSQWYCTRAVQCTGGPHQSKSSTPPGITRSHVICWHLFLHKYYIIINHYHQDIRISLAFSSTA